MSILTPLVVQPVDVPDSWRLDVVHEDMLWSMAYKTGDGQMNRTPRPWGEHPILFGDGSVLAMGQVADGWRQHVERFQDELPKTLDDRTVWGAHDWAAALYLRDALSRAQGELRATERDLAEQAIAEADEQYREMSELDDDGLLFRFLMELKPADPRGWWWRMIPKRGPVREELDGVIDLSDPGSP